MRSPLEDPQFQNLYEIVGTLGRGGMGEVVRIRHRVWEIDLAAKIPLKTTMTTTGGFPQLRREAETWIRLPSHPHVVTCHYVRTFADTPVIFIEFVEGGSLAQAIENGIFKHGATTEALVTQALTITLDIAHGLAHAHAAGVVHQDVKPSNVLLDKQGAKITDFGIASLGKSEVNAEAMATLRGNGTMVATVVGMTPLYASPEQLASVRASQTQKPEPITRASDIWSLGLTLLETLAGKASWQPGHVDHVLAKPHVLWKDVVDLLGRMLAKDATARPKAADIATEMTAILARRGIHRTPPTGAEMRADALNNRAISLLDLALVDEARQNFRAALAIDPCHPEAIFNDALLAWRAGDTTDQGALDRVRQAISTHENWEAKLLEGWIQIERGDEKAAWSVLDRVAEHAAGAARGTRAIARASRAARDSIREVGRIDACHGTADALAISHDERWVIVGARDGRVRIFDLSSGQCLQNIQAHTNYVFGVALTRDNSRVYSAGWDGVFTAHDVKTGKRIFEHKHTGKWSTLVLSADEQLAWTGNHSGILTAWSLTKSGAKAQGDILSLPHDWSIVCAALTPDRKTLLVGTEDSVLHWIEPATGATRKTLKLPSRAEQITFTKENGQDVLILGRKDQQVTLHDVESGAQFGALKDLQSWISEVAISPNGRWLVCSNGLQWCLWDLPARRCIRTFEAPALITGAIFLSNGELVTLDWQGKVRRYAIEAPSLAPMLVALPRRAHELAAGRVAVDADLHAATTALDAGDMHQAIVAARRARDAKGFERDPDVLEVWERIGNRATRKNIRTVWPVDRWGPAKATSYMTVDLSRRFLATANGAGEVTIWSLTTPGTPERYREFTFPEGELAARALCFSPDGSRLAVGTYNRLHVFDLADGTTRTSQEPRGYVRDMTFGGPNDSLIAALDDSGHAQVFRESDLVRIATTRGPENWVNAVAFASDERLLVGDYNGHLYCWDISIAGRSEFAPGEWSSRNDRKPEPAEALVCDLNQAAGAGQQSIFAIRVRDGRIYYACADKALHVIELASGKRIQTLRGHGSSVSGFDFLDEHHVVTVGFDKMVRIFDLRSEQCLSVVEGHTHVLWDVIALGPTSFLTASDDDQIRRFHIDWELEVAQGV